MEFGQRLHISSGKAALLSLTQELMISSLFCHLEEVWWRANAVAPECFLFTNALGVYATA